MNVKVIRCYYKTDNPSEKDLETTINQIGYENILKIFSEYFEDNEIAYTLLYTTDRDSDDAQNSISMEQLRAIYNKVGDDYKFGDVMKVLEKHYSD